MKCSILHINNLNNINYKNKNSKNIQTFTSKFGGKRSQTVLFVRSWVSRVSQGSSIWIALLIFFEINNVQCYSNGPVGEARTQPNVGEEAGPGWLLANHNAAEWSFLGARSETAAAAEATATTTGAAAAVTGASPAPQRSPISVS